MSAPYSYSRVLRRELYSPRSILAIITSVIVVILCIYVGVEIVLEMLHRRALLAAPSDMINTVARLGSTPTVLVLAIGAGLMIVGLILLIGAVKPGRRARHQMAGTRSAIVVDSEVIASALARTASQVGNVSPDNALVSVSARRVIVHLTPTSGTPINPTVVDEAVDEMLTSFDITPRLQHSVVVNPNGRVGA